MSDSQYCGSLFFYVFRIKIFHIRTRVLFLQKKAFKNLVGSKKYTNFASLFLPRKLNMNNLIQNTMRKHFLLSFALFCCAALWAVDESYYSSYINNKSGSNLFTGVHNVAKVGYSSLSYNGLWSAYCAIDINSSGKVWDMYSNTTSYTCGGSAQGANYSKEGDSYNREHSIPKSWFGGSENSNTPGTDLFHVVPTDGYVNNMRASFIFGEVSSASYTSNSGCKKGTPKAISIENSILGESSSQSPTSVSTVFEPMDEYKGDFARGYFGTMLKWANGDYQTFTTAPGNAIFASSYTEANRYGLTAYGVALLLKWHREDPVSQKEIDRNNGIQNQQGNRNPFIDYPVLAEFIWGKYTGETFLLTNAVGSFSEEFSSYPDGDKNGGGSSTTQYTITWSVNDVTSTTDVNENVRPTAPSVEDCSESRVFMGWTTSSTVSGDAPAVLYTSSELPKATAAATYYAVFADKQTSGSGPVASSQTFTFSEIATANSWANGIAYSPVTLDPVTITASGGGNNAKYYTSDNSWRMYNGGTVTISVANGSVTSVSSTPAQTFSISDGVASLSCTATIKFTEIVVNYSATGSTTFYSNYSTDCNEGTKVTITFHKNDGSDETSTQKVLQSTDASLKTNVFTRAHYTFDGWATTAEGAVEYAEGATINTATDIDLYAQWTEATKYTVTFMNNGSVHHSQTNYAGETITGLTDPTLTDCEDYTFKGWSSVENDSTTTNPVDYTGTIPAANMTYYAVYSKTVSGGSGSSNDYELYSGSLTEGDYVIYYDGKAMNTTVSSGRLGYEEVTPADDKISSPDASIIWHIAASGDYWTIYNEKAASYAAGTGVKNKAQMLEDGTDDKSLWTASGESTYEFVNKANTAASANANLRNNGTYGFACYATTTGGALSLYKKSDGSSTTYYTTSPACASEPCKATITITSNNDEWGTVDFVE